MQYNTIPKVKRWALITYKHGLYELHHQLPNFFRLKTLGIDEIL